MSVADEAAGLIKGLAEVVKSQQHVQQTALQQTNDELQTLSNTVASLTQKLPSSSAVSHGPSLRLPNLVLPIYTSREHLDRFLTQLESILKASGVPTQYWLTYLKQQTQKDSRAFDAICEAETSNIKFLGEDPSRASPNEFLHLYEMCVTSLKAKRGKPRDQQLRELLSAYYTMRQQNDESVADFAHRFTETQNELEKLLPNIHRTPASWKYQHRTHYSIYHQAERSFAKELISRDVKHTSLQAVISAAERFEMHLPSLALTQPAEGREDLPNCEPVAHYSGTLPRRPTRPQSKDTGRSSRDHYDPKLNSSGISDSSSSFRPRARPHNFSVQGSSPQKSKEICLMFNKFKSSNCELPNNQCANHRLHKCSFCHKWGCKACNHRANGPGHFNKSKGQKSQGHAHVVSNPSLSGQGSGNGDESRSSSSPSEPSSKPELTTVLSNMQQSLQNLSVCMEKLERPRNPIASVASHVPPSAVSGTDILKQAPTYSCPAVTAIPQSPFYFGSGSCE